MGKGIVKVGQTLEGKYFAQVRTLNNTSHETTHYETPEYVTQEMALADAKCWKEFHMDETPKPAERSINVEDTVRTLDAKNGVPVKTWTGPEFSKWLAGAQAKFPNITFRIATEFGGRKTKGDDFFIITKLHATARERCFIVKKP